MDTLYGNSHGVNYGTTHDTELSEFGFTSCAGFAEIDRILYQTIFFHTLGLIGGCAVKSGALELPDFEGPAAMYVREKEPQI